MEINKLKEALELWVEITGVHPEQHVFKGFHELHISVINDELKKSLQYDKSGTTTLLFLDALTEEFLNQMAFNVNKLIYNPSKVQTYIAKCQALYSILRADEVNSFRDKFRNNLRAASTSVCKGELPDEAEKMLKSNNNLAYLRRDAVRSLSELRVFQFLQGEPDSELPQYNDVVYEFWNVNSLIRALCSIPSGVVICLIRDPDQYQCYFVFGIRNGGTITILTDKPKYPHPRSRYIQRRPDRAFGNRAYRNHFPYDLMDFKTTEDGEIYFPSVSDSKGLVLYQNIAHPMKPIKDLHADEILWITMMFDLIIDKFFKKNFKALELAYTGEMVRYEDALIGSPQAKALTVTDYPTLAAKQLQVKDASYEETVHQWGRKPTGDNKWLEDKFAHEIQAESLNLLGPPRHETSALNTKTNEITQVKTDALSPWRYEKEIYEGDIVQIKTLPPAEVYWSDVDYSYRLAHRGDRQYDKTKGLFYASIGQVIGNIWQNPELPQKENE